MPILPNKRTFYTGLQKRDVMSVAGNQPSQLGLRGFRGGARTEHLGPEREDSAWDLAFCPALHTLVIAGSQRVVESMSERSSSPDGMRKCTL